MVILNSQVDGVGLRNLERLMKYLVVFLAFLYWSVIYVIAWSIDKLIGVRRG